MAETAQVQVQSPIGDFFVDTHLERNDTAVEELIASGVSLTDAAAAVVEARVTPTLEGPMRTLQRIVRMVDGVPPITPELIERLPEEDWPRLSDAATWCQSMIMAYFQARTAKEAREGRAALRDKKKRSRKESAAEEQKAERKEAERKRAESMVSKVVGKGEVNDVEVGDDKGELLLDYSLFIRLNAKAKAGGVTQEQFVAKPIATRKAFEEACKLKYKEDLDGIKGHNERFTVLKNMWTERFERKRTWCVERGRVMEYVRFIKDNKDTLRRCSLSPSIVWGNYNQTWNALCGTEVVKLRTPRAGKEEEEPEPEPEKKADKKRKARPVETSEEEEPAAGGAAAEEAEEEEDSEDA